MALFFEIAVGMFAMVRAGKIGSLMRGFSARHFARHGERSAQANAGGMPRRCQNSIGKRPSN
jgi:hypothetical protein